MLLFDVNETLLDLAALRPRFETVFGPDPPLGEWFARLLHASLVANHLDSYRPFGRIGAEQLQVVAQRRGVELSTEAAADLAEGLLHLPPHPDVGEGLEQLAAAGLRMVALTNGAQQAVETQLAGAGIDQHFERAMSVEGVGRFKPDAAVYRWAAEQLGVAPGEAMMVAAHDWDVAGALHAGMQAAYIARPQVAWSIPPGPPDFTVPDLPALAEQLR